MLYRLEIENFYSIRDQQVLDLRVPKSVTDYPERYAPLFAGSDDRVAKAIALFGPNGSGKSTVLRALAFIGWFVRESFQHRGNLPCERFNDQESANRPIRLAIELGGPMDLPNWARATTDSRKSKEMGTLRYELHLESLEGVVRNVSHEALRMRPNGQGKWKRLFERSFDRSVLGSGLFPLAGYSQVIDKIRADASVISTLALFEHEASKLISEAANKIFSNILTEYTAFDDSGAVKFFAQNPEMLASLNRELQRIDVGVEHMRIMPDPSGPVAVFKHQGLHLDMPLTLESHGTRSFIRILPLILVALKQGGIAIVDELDQSIHPLLLPEIVRWFYDRDRNPHDAQLWMSCHSASLLDDLTKEEVVLCDKDSLGRSTVYSLMDVGAVRRTDNLYKKYLGGVYGAVPQVG